MLLLLLPSSNLITINGQIIYYFYCFIFFGKTYTVRKKGFLGYMKKGFPEWSVLEPLRVSWMLENRKPF